MFCSKCGTQLPDNAAFCTNCGNPMAANNPQSAYQQPPQQPAYQQPVYQQPVYQQPPSPAPGTIYNPAAALPMKWFKFMINFALWCGAILNISQAGSLFSGMIYGEDTELVYGMFEDMETLNIVMGVLLAIIAGLQIFARFRLAAFCKNGPALLYAVYGAVVVSNLVYVIGIYSVLPGDAMKYLDFTSFYTNTAINLCMLSCNITYFKKRKHLFVH